MKLLRLIHTLRHVPLQRHLDRLKIRGTRIARNRSPERFLEKYRDTARQLPSPHFTEPVLATIARQHLFLKAGTATSYELLTPTRAQIEIHNVSRQIDLEAPYAVETGEGNNQLWKMSLGYTSYLLADLAEGKPEALQTLISMLSSWSSIDCWKSPGIFDSQWHPYSASHRLLNSLLGTSLYLQSGGTMSPGELQQLTGLIGLHAAFVYANIERELQYNHLQKNLHVLAIFEIAAEGCVRQPTARDLARTIRDQVLRDGGQAELCPMYHHAFLADMLTLAAAGQEALGPVLNPVVQEDSALMLNAGRVMSFQNGAPSLFGDSWYSEAACQSQLDKAAVAVGIAGNSISDFTHLPDTGYAKFSLGPLELILDCGRYGPGDNPGHAHDDFLSFECAWNGERLILDYGVANYSEGDSRQRTRTNELHNGPRFHNRDGIECWSKFRVARRAAPPSVHFFDHLEYKGCAMMFQPLGGDRSYVFRTLLVAPDQIIIQDAWLTGSHRPQPRSTFLLNPSFRHVDARMLQATLNDGTTWVFDSQELANVTDGHHFDVYAIPRIATQVELTPNPSRSSTFLSTIALSRNCAISVETAKATITEIVGIPWSNMITPVRA